MSERKRTVIGRYEIIGRLGEGAMAAVYKAYDPRFKREVALKVLRRRYASNPTIIERFHREALAIAQLEHPAIVPIYDAGRDGDWVYIVMRYMSGGTLADRMAQTPEMSVDEMTQVIERVGSAFDMAHSKGIIHRDIKPANILFDQRGAPFLADFGIVKLENTSKKSLTVIDDGAPVGSAAIGTPEYMSPEQVRGDRTVDGRSDIYSLGVVLYEMLSGEPPFVGEGTLQTAIQHTTTPVPKIADVAPKYKKWQSILDKAMAKKREKRFQTGRAFADTVIKTGRSDTRSFGTRSIPAAGKSGRSRLPLALGGLSLLLILGGVGAFLFNQQQRVEEDDSNAVQTSLQQTADAQDVLIASMQSDQATAVAEFEATKGALEATSEAAEQTREADFSVQISEIAAEDEEACTGQADYDFEVGRITFSPRLGTMLESDVVAETISAQWDVVNEGCPARNVRLVGEDGTERMPAFVDATGAGQGNEIFEGESAVMVVSFDSIEEANGVDEQLRFVVDAPNGEPLTLDDVDSLQLSVPNDETWMVVVTPTPELEPTEVEVVENEPTNDPDQPDEPDEEVANGLVGDGDATNTPRPTRTSRPTPEPTNTDRPQVTDTPNWNATQTRDAEQANFSADATARVVDATRTKQAEDAKNSQTREANNRKATADAFNRGGTATVQAQRAANAFRATETKRAEVAQANVSGTRQVQTRQAEQNARNFQATQTKQVQNAHATLTRQAQINAGRSAGTATAQAQQATADAYNAQATLTRQAQINAGNAAGTATAQAQQATTNAYNVQATQTRQAQINVANATATRQEQIRQATLNAPTNTPIPIPPMNTPRPANTVPPVQPTQPSVPPTAAPVAPSIMGSGTCVVGGNGFITDQVPFRWSWPGTLNGRTFSIRVIARGQSPQNGGAYIKMNMGNDVNIGNGVWQTSGFGTGLKPGEYSWSVALVDGMSATFSTNTGCLINTD